MLHGCRTDLILKCLVYSNKDRNFSLQLLNIIYYYCKYHIQNEWWNENDV